MPNQQAVEGWETGNRRPGVSVVVEGVTLSLTEHSVGGLGAGEVGVQMQFELFVSNRSNQEAMLFLSSSSAVDGTGNQWALYGPPYAADLMRADYAGQVSPGADRLWYIAYFSRLVDRKGMPEEVTVHVRGVVGVQPVDIRFPFVRIQWPSK